MILLSCNLTIRWFSTLALSIILCATIDVHWSNSAELEFSQWGLNGPREYKESSATLAQNSAFNPESNEGDTFYRYFSAQNPAYFQKITPLLEPTTKAYKEFINSGGSPSARPFADYLKSRLPFVVAGFRDISPVLYFDFRGARADQFILDEITIEVLNFSEYSGGGFSDGQADYNIVLSPKLGVHRYSINNNKLRFNGSGRAELRFSSGNFYKSVGLSPMGAYLIDISFVFRKNGSANTILKTGPFKIDV